MVTSQPRCFCDIKGANDHFSDDQYPFLLVDTKSIYEEHLDAAPNSLNHEVHSHMRAILEAPDEETKAGHEHT